MEENKLIETVEKDIKKDYKKLHKDYGSFLYPIGICLVVIMVVVSFVIVKNSISNAAASAKKAYDNSLSSSYDEKYSESYEYYFNKTRTSNDVGIQITSIKEISSLEILRVSEYIYLTKNGTSQDDDFAYWTKNWGYGVFTINLNRAEFIVDEENNYVLARIPEPEVEYRTDSGTEILLNKNKGIFDGNANDGSQYAKDRLNAANKQLLESIKQNASYYETARQNAIEKISELIKNSNSTKTIDVEVEFIDDISSK